MDAAPAKRNELVRQVWGRALWLARHEGLVLAGLLAIALGIWGFIEIAQEVVSGNTRAFDEWVIRSVRQPQNPAEPIGPHWMKNVGIDITALGGASVVFLVTLCVGIFLYMQGKKHAMWLAWVATLGGALLSVVLKNFFDRPRPDIVPHLSEVSSASFPSGHSLMSAVVYLTLGALVAQFVLQRRVRIYIFSVAVFLTGIVGLSRIYLGVHYPTDVLAGWTAGLVWALFCWIIATYLQRRGKVEPPGMNTEEMVEGQTEGAEGQAGRAQS